MTTTRAAKYLAPVDFGKTITITDADTDKTVTGQLQRIDAVDYNIELGILAGKDSGGYRVGYDDEVTLVGQPSPPTEDPHGVSFRGEPELAAIRPTFHGSDQAEPAQPLPAPIPAAQAADHTGHVPHFTVHKDGHIEQHLQVRPRRNGKNSAYAVGIEGNEIDYRDLQRTINEANLAGARAYEDELWQKAISQDAVHPSNHDYAWSITGPEYRPCVVCGRPETEHRQD